MSDNKLDSFINKWILFPHFNSIPPSWEPNVRLGNIVVKCMSTLICIKHNLSKDKIEKLEGMAQEVKHLNGDK